MQSTSIRILSVAICLAFFLVCISADFGDGVQPVVHSGTAIFHGKRIEVAPHKLPDFHGSVAAFTRIPYAEPPVGELRFKRPVPKVIEGDFNATRGPIACLQTTWPALDIGMETAEDCLFLDIFVPDPKPSSAAVMVWIHGGNFQHGAGSISKLLPIPLATINDVIVVTCNFRLNVLGFLASGDDEIPANLGLLDQRQVLLWVQENIGAFGGDPSRVTIFGESAGGASVSLLLLSPMTDGLYSGAIMQSGTMSKWSHGTVEEAVKMAFTFGSVMNCSANTTVELATCLRAKSPDELLQNFVEYSMMIYPHPVADGEFFTKDPLDIAAEGSFCNTNIMMGCLEEEGNIYISPIALGGKDVEKPRWNLAMLHGLLDTEMAFWGPGKVVDQLTVDTVIIVYASAEQLGDPEANLADIASQFIADGYFLCSTFSMAELFAAAGNPVYLYIMTHQPSASMWGKNVTWMGATHMEDIPYVFGSPLMLSPDVEESYITGNFNDEEVALSLQMMKYWSNFAKTGNPNLSSMGGEVDQRYPMWSNFTKEEPNYKELSRTFENLHGHPGLKRCYFQQHVIPALFQNSAEMARLKSLVEEEVNVDSGDAESCGEE